MTPVRHSGSLFGSCDDSTSYIDDAEKEGARARLHEIVEGINAAGIPSEVYNTETSVAAQLKTIDSLTPAQNGFLLKETGEEWKS